MKQLTCVIWVCVDCMLHHANGECGNCHEDNAHDCEPWSQLDPGDEATMGMFHSEHAEHCAAREHGLCDWDCEIRDFSWSSCSGCGSDLGGDRYAFTLWWTEATVIGTI